MMVRGIDAERFSVLMLQAYLARSPSVDVYLLLQ